VKPKRIKGTDPAGPLAENVARIVKVRLDELRGFTPAALAPDGIEAQHDMRIAAKRLRYVLEATGSCFGKTGDRARRRARDLQDLLGEMHDVDVILPRVREHRRRLRDQDASAVRQAAGEARDLDPALSGQAPHRTAYRGLDLLEVHMLARRRLLHDRFVETWRSQERKGVWRELERVAERALDAAERRRSAAARAERAREELQEAERAEQQAAQRAEQAAAALAAVERERLG
jgi:hypothetical protein